ncbi:hypothetical protein I308_101075 [Cryptococcus tetragattii IND107]|uniref:Histone deacetylase domain-containing protein n=1 Tax=Cryptococcus tetragattii IND107 TaxID=1296105 RepID=A0ABR3BZU0_9TREE
MAPSECPLGLYIQPACLQHRYIRHTNASHIFERPERLRAVLLGVAAAVAGLEQRNTADDLASLLSSLSLVSPAQPTAHLHLVPAPPLPPTPGTILLHHPAVQLAHSPVPDAPFPYIGPPSTGSSGAGFPSSSYLRDLVKWANGAVDRIKQTGCEIPEGLGLNPGDLYLGPGSIIAIEGAIQTVCQAVDHVVRKPKPVSIKEEEPSTPPVEGPADAPLFTKAFCAIRPPGHHCGEDAPSGFCYVNNVVIGALHGYLQHDIDRAIIIDFDLHHGNGTQALVMPLNAASYADDIQVKAGKPPIIGQGGRRRRGWKGFYGSVHDIYSYPCEDGDLDLIRDASISLAAHGQYIENIHLKPYTSEADFYERIYPLYLALLDKAKVFMEETEANPERTIVFISAGFDACEWEHQGMQRHDRRVPVSFYSRYTRDIAAFADKYTEGKVVSVLEGGYSDRALTSAAMGHIVGMRGSLPEGCDEWWTEKELINLEKATKKKRGGKLAPLPAEFASQPHLSRTHSLLAHFEGVTSTESVASTATNTPMGTRMTLRDRRRADEAGGASVESTPGSGGAKGGKGRAAAAAVAAVAGTPATSKLKTSSRPIPTDTPSVEPETNTVAPSHNYTPITDKTLETTQSSLEKSVSGEKEMGDWIEEAVKDITKMSLEEHTSTPVPVHEFKSQSFPPLSHTPTTTTTTTTLLPKIILRIPARPTTDNTAEQRDPIPPPSSQSDQQPPLDIETQARSPSSEAVTYNSTVTAADLLNHIAGGH